MARPGIMLYFDIMDPIRVLPDEDKGRLLMAILEYGKYGVVPEFSGMLAMAWGFLQPKLDRDEESYENKSVQRKYAAFCKKRVKLSRPKIPFEEWLEMDENERERLVTEDNEPQRAVDFVGSRYPTTTAAATTPTATTAPTTTPTTTTPSTSTAAAAETTAGFAQGAAATAEKKLKVMNGALGKGVVHLSEAQIEDLLDKMDVELFDYYVDKLSSFIIREGAQVKNHYATILKWWREDGDL